VARPDTPSIRQPLVAYALVFMGAACFGTAILFSFATVSSSRRAYQRAIEARLEVLARLPTPELEGVLTGSTVDEPEVFLVRRDDPRGPTVTTSSRAPRAGFASTPPSWDRALELLRRPESPWVIRRAVRDRSLLLVARVDSTIPTAVAFAAIARTVPFALLVMLVLAGLYTLVTSRLLLPPLDALATVADQVEEEPLDVLGRERAPNEIVEVAQKFRRTVRRLRSERERVEEQKLELERMQESLIRASKLAGIGRLAAGIAHEVGNPLSAVRGYLGLLADGLEPDEQADVLRRSRAELERIHETIRGLLTYARSGTDATAPPETISVHSVLEDALQLARGHPALRGVTVEVAAGPDPAAWAQPARLQQVILNLLLNAAQAMVSVNGPRIDVEVGVDDDDRVFLQIDDVGPGVPDDVKASIFDPFFTTKAPGEGTGLGLAVSRALMEGMGGDLTVEDRAGGGARFVAWLAPAPRLDRPGGGA